MEVTPSQLFSLALKRHRIPWNWTVHFIGLIGFSLSLMLHSYLMFATSFIVLGAGFFELGLPQMRQGRWQRFVHDSVEWEKNWVAAPWNWRKIWRFIFVLTMIFLSLWSLIAQEPVAISLLLAFIYLLTIVRKNKEGGIDP